MSELSSGTTALLSIATSSESVSSEGIRTPI